jgi:hypothetical protein
VERREDPDREQAALIAAVIGAHEEARRLRPPREGGGDGAASAWRILGRPGALPRGR